MIYKGAQIPYTHYQSHFRSARIGNRAGTGSEWSEISQSRGGDVISDNAIELKDLYSKRIRDRLLPKLPWRPGTTVVQGVQDSKSINLAGPQTNTARRSIAFGVAKGKRGQSKLAVLIQDRRLRNAYEIDEICKRTKG
jgi:hypothetical protein